MQHNKVHKKNCNVLNQSQTVFRDVLSWVSCLASFHDLTTENPQESFIPQNPELLRIQKP